MKKIFKRILVLSLVLSMFALVGCKGDVDLPRSFMVRFETGEFSSDIAPQTVKEGYRVSDISTPISSKEAMFRGWYSDSEYIDIWDIDTYRVTEDVTLYAKWSYPEVYPTEFSLGNDAFTKTISWIQKGITSSSDISIEVCKGVEKDLMEMDERLGVLVKVGTYIDYTGVTPVSVPGDLDINGYNISFTATDSYVGGVYKFIVTTNKESVDKKEFLDVSFKGNGTLEDPYRVYNEQDLLYITTNSFDEGTYTILMSDVTIHSVYNEKKGSIYNGKFDGNGKTVTIKNNSGLFYEIGEKGEVTNLKLKGSISGSDPSIGVVANYNKGYIHNVESSAVSVNGTGGKVNDLSSLSKGGAGGIVGTNLTSGRITNCSIVSAQDNVIQGKIGIGCVAGINYGKIYDMNVAGIVGAYNGNEISATINNSFAGIAVGVNYGSLYRVNVDGKINCRRVDLGNEGDGATNVGGVVGYNATGAKIEECFYHGMRCVGDTNVGGIAGYNDGTIIKCYTGRRVRKPSNTTDEERQFISPVIGSYNVGGIVGKCGEHSIISNVFSTANVWAYREEAYAVAEKASNTVYCLYNQNYRTSDRWLGQKYGVVVSDKLIAPIGENTLGIDNSSRKNLTINHLLGWEVKEIISPLTGNKSLDNVKNEELVTEILGILGSGFKADSSWGIVLSWNR